jgi:RNA polymerase sigma factor (sigma-70 family)
MATLASAAVVRQIGSLFEGSAVAGLSDRQLLDRFTAQRDAAGQAAFAALVMRHGPMVLGVCLQFLGDRHHAEDAFQAVFLILARKARSIRDPDLLGNWLYGVAMRTSRYARLRLSRQRKNEEAGSMLDAGSSVAVASAEQSVLAREQAALLHDEIERLPRAFRLAVVLCYLEGLTVHEAARRLRCSHGTVRSRMARARDKLRRALIRRGVVLPAAALAATLAPRSASASVSPDLCETTARAAIQFAAGQAAAPLVTALALEVLRSMMYHKLKLLALTLLLLGAIATSAGYLARALGRNDEPKSRAADRQAPLEARPDDANQKPAPGRMFVVGRVLDPQGKPVPGAMVTASARTKLSRDGVPDRRDLNVIAHADADESGRFRLDAPRTSSSRDDEFMAVALAPGYGVGWAEIDPDDDQPTADISLRPEQVIDGRLFDLQGRPAQGVVVSVSGIRSALVPNLPQRDPLRIRFGGPNYWWARVNDIPAWPKPTATDANGRFAIHGVGRGVAAQLTIVDPRFALQSIDVQTDDAPGAKLITIALQPAKTLIGHVTYADTGKPVPHARVGASARGAGQPGIRPTTFQTDADGRFRANLSPGDHFLLIAYPPDGQLYLSALKRVEWPKGAIEQSVDLVLPRGVVIRGRVTEEGSKAPVAGAWVNFRSHLRPGADSSDGFRQSATGADGSFELAVAPGPGHLAVQVPNEDYVLREIGNRELVTGQPGGNRVYSHNFVACNPQPGSPGLDVNVALRRGVTVAGRVVGPDDRPVPDTWVIGRAALGPSAGSAWRGWWGNYHGNAPSGRFELHGLDSDSEIPVYFFQPVRKLGATALLSGKSAAGGPVTIRLEPCGTGVARLVDAKSQPLAGYRGYEIRMFITPGPDWRSREVPDANRVAAEGAFLTRIDSINYAEDPKSDLQGRITFPALIPGASYRIVDRTTLRDPSGPKVRKDFTVKAGETLDLGDILIEKPQAR